MAHRSPHTVGPTDSDADSADRADFEEQGLIVVHRDLSGKRIVAFPDLQAETAPGAADAHYDAESRNAAE